MATHRSVTAENDHSGYVLEVLDGRAFDQNCSTLQLQALEDLSDLAIAVYQNKKSSPVGPAGICEVGMVRVRSASEVSSFHAVADPEDHLRITQVNAQGQVTETDQPGPSSAGMLQQARLFAGNASLVVHNAASFRRWWGSGSKTSGIDNNNDLICTLLLARRLCQSLASHTLSELEKALNLRAQPGSHALQRAEQLAQVFAALCAALKADNASGVIDASYLLAYQRKSKSALPDLTQVVRQCASSASRENNKTPSAAAFHGVAEAPVSHNADRHAESNQPVRMKKKSNSASDPALSAAIGRHNAILEFFARLNLPVSKQLIPPAEFKAQGGLSRKKRDYIIYDKSGLPTDIEYLSFTEPKPEEPAVSARPNPNDFVEEVSLWEKVTLRKSERYEAWKASYLAALKRWERSREQERIQYIEQARRWQSTARDIDRKNDLRYQQCLKDQETWWAEELALTDIDHGSDKPAGACYPVCDSREPQVVQRFFMTVLSRLKRPDWIRAQSRAVYRPGRRILEVSVSLPHPDTLPELAAMSRGRAGECARVRLLSKNRRTALYARIVWQTCLQSLRLIACIDKHHLIDHILLNGVITDSGSEFGSGNDRCIVSLSVSKSQVLAQPLEAEALAECFASLGGRGSAKDLARLRTIIPYTLKDAELSLDTLKDAGLSLATAAVLKRRSASSPDSA